MHDGADILVKHFTQCPYFLIRILFLYVHSFSQSLRNYPSGSLERMISKHISEPDHGLDIAIIGGGLAGLTLSIGLSNHGIKHKIYEAAATFADIGAGISTGKNAIAALSLIDPRIIECYDRCTTAPSREREDLPFLSFRWGMAEKHRDGLSYGDIITYNNSQRGGRNSVNRARFVEQLATLIPPSCVSFNKTLMHISQSPDSVTLTFADGSTAIHSAAVGCDGIKSVMRQIVLGLEHPPVFSGEYAYRALLPRAKVDAIFGHDMLSNGNMFCGKGAYVFLYPVDGGKMINWISVHKRDMEWEDHEWVVPVSKEVMLDDYQGWGNSVREVLGLVEQPSRWALFDVPSVPRYCKDRIVLMGDAAHACTPNVGAGASMAFEDAFILSSLLSEMKQPDRIDEVFKAFDEIRRPRTQKVVATSREVFEFNGFCHGDDGQDLDKFKENVRSRYWMWDVDLPAEVERARFVLSQASGRS